MSSPSSGGRWVELARPPYATDPIRCSCCGVMIPRRYWDVGAGLARAYCTPSCRLLEERVESLRGRRPTPPRS
jgi:hypothetical protein